jgi:hypothetical protein
MGATKLKLESVALDNPDTIINHLEKLKHEMESEKELQLTRYEHLRITESTEIDPPLSVLKIAGETIAVNGDIFTISGASKSGKSAVAGMAISGAISDDGVINYGLENMSVSPNQKQFAVIHFDTEQARHKHKYNVQSILRRAELSKCPDYYLSYNIRQLDLKDYADVTSGICDAAAKQFGGIHSIWIDGGADYFSDVNNLEQSYAIIKYFESIAIQHDTAVFFIVHTNPGSDKERGHFGSQAQRKSGGILLVKTEGERSIVESKLLRYAGTQDVPQMIFVYDKEKGFHVGSGIKSVSAIEEEKNKRTLSRIEALVKVVFDGQASHNYTSALGAIMKKGFCAERTAKNNFKIMNLHEMILQGTDKKWRLNHEYFSEL